MEASQDDRYREASAAYGAALERLAGANEADPDDHRRLLQEIYLALWRSFAGWDARCSPGSSSSRREPCRTAIRLDRRIAELGSLESQ